jgi:hypothetical protein
METSPFNRLPAELRTTIYEYVFTFDSVRCQDSRWRAYEKQKSRPRRSDVEAVYHLRAFRLATRLGPTLVCRQMRGETLHLLMALNELVCGNERRDVDPYYEFLMGPRLLKDPCEWASRALDKGRSVFVSPSTAFRVHVWVYPCMRNSTSVGDWREFEDAFAGLVDGSFPGKVVVSLHFFVDYQPLVCEYRQQQGGRADVANSQFEYGVFEIGLDGGGCGNGGLGRLFDEKREVLRGHESHERGLCDVAARGGMYGMLAHQLRQTEEMVVLVVQMARVKRVERLSLAMSEHV